MTDVRQLDYIPLSQDRRPINAGWLSTTYSAESIAAAPHVAVRTGGELPGGGYLCVVDIDVKKGDGEATWAEFVDEPLPATYEIRTKSAGRHIYLRTTEPVGCPMSGVAHVDIRGKGGYVVAPPSPGYSVLVDADIAWCPLWLEKHLLSQAAGRRSGRSDADMADDVPVDLTREMLEAWCEEHQSLGLAQRITSLLAGRPIAGPGQRHEILRLRLIPELLGTFGPGVTLESLAALLAGDYPGHVFPDSDLHQLEDALVTARRRCDPQEHLDRAAAERFGAEAVVREIEKDKKKMRDEQEKKGISVDSLASKKANEFMGELTTEALAWRFLATSDYIYSKGEWYHWANSHWEHLEQPPVNAISDILRIAGLRKPSDHGRNKRKAILDEAAELCANILKVRMDQHRHLTAFPNGTWDRGVLRAARREDYITRCARTPLTLGAKHPQWDLFLSQASCGDPDWVRHLQFLLGIGFAGTRSELLPVFCGVGANLKSTILQTIMYALGEGMITTLDAGVFVDNGRDRHTSFIGRTLGAKVAVSTELRADCRLNWSMIKRLLGETAFPVQTRMGGDVIDMIPTCGIAIDMNGMPVSMEAGRAEKRRLRIFPWLYDVSDKAMVAGWHKQFLTDPEYLEAVVAWVVEGSLIEREPRCAREVAETAKLFRESDDANPLVDWLAECVVEAPGAFTSRRDVRSSYDVFARNDRDRLSNHKLYRYLRTQYQEHQSNDSRGFLGFRIRTPK